MLSFRAITWVSEGIVQHIASRVGQGFEGRVLSYLPLAHSFERSWVEAASFVGGTVHIFFAESLGTFLEDLKRSRPTTFISVPRLWLKFQQGVFAKMPPKKLDRLLSIPFLGKIVGRKVLAGLGLNLIEGYAMTENFGYSHNSTEALNAPGYVGVPLPGVEVRISPQGEVLIKSPGQLSGYYKRPDLDSESFTDDGFFHTGDLGEQRADGLLKITGRLKELFKTAKGQYVSPAPIENRLNAHPMVEMSLVSGVGQPSAYAMVVLAENLRLQSSDPDVRAKVEGELGQLLQSVNQQLPDYEQLRMIVVAREPWSIENGCLTPTMKNKRSRIEAAVAAQVGTWYANRGAVHWA